MLSHPLHLFPESGFDKSATTPVLLGVLVSWLFTETFGWVFAGLVVPGYLAALFLLDPRVATIDVVEAVVTYGVARSLGEHLARTGLTSRMFGRERFFLIVLVSIVVRLATEGVVLPRLASHATWAFSIGLVVVPLTANACWKTGLWRGALQTGLPAVVVYVLLRYVLLPHTNLSLAGFNLATENISASFLASPKLYILLLTGALLAAFANLRYGWDYNGILIPALLTLVAIHPLKLGATVAEVMVLLGVARLLVNLTPLRRANIEGPRRLVLFFTLDYGLRFAFAAIVGRSLPAADVVDLMGFGYLLPTLLAVKISQKGLASLVLLPALTVSVIAFGVGTLVGFAAAEVDRAPEGARRPITRAIPRAPGDPSSAALWVAALARPAPAPAKGSVGSTISASKLASAVDALLADATAALPPELEAQRLERDVLLVRERFEGLQDRLGEPSVLAAAKTSAAEGRLVVVVAGPLRCPECAALAGSLLETRAVDAVVVSGVEETEDGVAGPVTAGAVARSLAGRKGLVASLRRADADVARARLDERAHADARTQAFLRALRDHVGDLRDDEAAADAAEVTIELPAARADRWLKTPPSPVPLESGTEISAALDGVRRSTTPVALEDRLALRRLVLEPLLDASPGALPSSVVSASAAMLGYTLRGPSRLADGSEAMALLPGPAPRPIAVLSRTGGVRGTVVEVPHGAHEGVRALGVELAGALRADALIVGLESGGRLFGNEALRDAHGAATWPRPGREARVVVLREATLEADESKATVGAWPAVGTEALLASVESALRDAGIRSTRAPIDLAAREEAGRSFFGDTWLVAVTAGPKTLRNGALDSTLVAMRELASLPRFDAPCAEVAERLAAGLPSGGPPAPDTLLDTASRAAVERSVVARRALEDAVGATASRAALARTTRGVQLVVVGRTAARALLVAAIPVLADTSEPSPLQDVPSLGACLPRLASGGRCRVEAP